MHNDVEIPDWLLRLKDLTIDELEYSLFELDDSALDVHFDPGLPKRVSQLAGMRKELALRPFGPRPVRDFLNSIAKSVGSSASDLGGYFGLDSGKTESPAFASTWGKFSKRLGLTLRQSVECLRLSYVERFDPGGLVRILAVHRSSPSSTSVNHIPNAIKEGVEQLDHEVRQLLAQSEEIVAGHYSDDSINRMQR